MNPQFPDPHSQPLMKSWRCELTALSHTYNLYFVACNETIYIYEPTFPCQTLDYGNSFVLHPPKTSPNLPSHIDPEDPHSITRLHVDYLGTDEVLIVTCDDGDAIGYRVPEIFRAIESRRNLPPESEVILGDDEVRVFLHRNIEASAWGIAVHQEARLIALSANTHRITVFVFALSNGSDEVSIIDRPDGEIFSNQDHEKGLPSHRNSEHTIILQANSNIPAVSFDNTDPSGRWLMSNTIDGRVHLWDLFRPQQPARMITLGSCVSVQNPTIQPKICQCPNRTSVPHAVWAAMFIDPRYCHPTNSLQEACGSGIGDAGPLCLDPCFWDITETDLRYTSTRVPPIPMPSELVDADSEFDEMPLLDSTDSTGSSEEVDEDVLSDEDVQSLFDDASIAQGQGSFTITQQPQGEAQSPISPPPPTNNSANGDAANETSIFVPDGDSPMMLIDSSDEEYDEGVDAAFVAQTLTSLPLFPPAPEPDTAPDPPRQPYCSIGTYHNFADEFRRNRSFEARKDLGPVVIVTKEEIYLLQSPHYCMGDHRNPILFMRNPLYPPLKTNNNGNTNSSASSSASTTAANGGRGPIPHYHRHCYATQIPELGIFIVATPAGRVGVFRLTRNNTPEGKVVFGFRLECILPRKERRDDRRGNGGNEAGEAVNIITDVWGRRLVGVAVGPLQGMLDKEGSGGRRREDNDEDSGDDNSDDDSGDEHQSGFGSHAGRGASETADTDKIGSRRWRLMMLFHDHTVYTYQLEKRMAKGVSGLGDLVV